jgi:magnesium chelatase subunit ChlD-like protein
MRLHWPRTLARKGPAPLAAEHFTHVQLRQRTTRLQLFVLDCSASMLAGNRLALCKGALVKLLERAYQQRDQVALICFAGNHAELRIPPRPAASSNARDNATHWLQPIKAGGSTPLARAVSLSDRLLKQWREQHAARQHSVWLISDGRSNELPARPAHADLLYIIDCEQQRIRLGQCEQLARQWQCDYLTLDQIVTL